MASEPGLSLLEGTMHHRFFISTDRLQRFVAFQTAAGSGERHGLGPELLATRLVLAARPRQLGQHRSQSFPSRADAAPFWKGHGGSQLAAPGHTGGREAGVKERRECVCERSDLPEISGALRG